MLGPSGLVVVDNVLWGDLLASLEKTSQNTVMLQDLNAMVPADRSVTMSLLPMGDALTLAVMRR